MSAEPYYLTSEGYKHLKDEYRHLKKVEKPKLLKQVKEARSKGNLDNNPEFENVREQQMILEGRIYEIEEILDNAKVVDIEKTDSNKVDIGNTVTVEIDGNEEQYQIVGSAEADPVSGKISYESPVGKALLGLKPGDSVDILLPHTKLHYTVVAIHTP